MINSLGEGVDTPSDNDYYISQFANGGTTHKTYHRRPVSALWNYIKSKADEIYAKSSHAHSNYENQNAFSTVKVGSTSVSADTATDTLTLTAGNNVTITPDATNDKITISSTDTKYTHPTTSGNKHIPSGGSSGQILRWSADGTAVWGTDNNTTYGVVSTTADGLAPKRDGSTTKYLRADGTWATPPDTNTTYSNMTAATASAAGKAGLVPAPASGKQASFLRGDGTWVVPTNTTYSTFVKSGSGAKAGLVPAPSTTAGTTKYLREDGTWANPSLDSVGYEEGTWSPTQPHFDAYPCDNYTFSSGTYYRIGNIVVVTCGVNAYTVAGSESVLVDKSSLPFPLKHMISGNISNPMTGANGTVKDNGQYSLLDAGVWDFSRYMPFNYQLSVIYRIS